MWCFVLLYSISSFFVPISISSKNLFARTSVCVIKFVLLTLNGLSGALEAGSGIATINIQITD